MTPGSRNGSADTELVRVYTNALATGVPPRVSVAKYFRITVAAAASRIYRARKRGLLQPWHRAEPVVEQHTLSGVVTEPAARVAGSSRRTVLMSATERQALRKALEDGKACPQCGGLHTRACPRVKRMVYGAQGVVSEVEFFPPGVWSDEAIIWPEDLEADDSEADTLDGMGD